jgi:hypothetical protein
MGVITDRAMDKVKSFLLFKGLTAPEPTLKFMTLGTNQIKSNHA